MINVSNNGKKALKILFSDFLTDYNAGSISSTLGISAVGSLKLLRNLKEQGLVRSRRMGKALFYRCNLGNRLLLKFMELFYLDHSSWSSFVRGWIVELQQFEKVAEVTLLYGSLLIKGKKANDIDACFILKKASDYRKADAKVKSLNSRNRQAIHPLYLTMADFRQKLRSRDPVIISIVKTCVVVGGVETFVKEVRNVQSRESS